MRNLGIAFCSIRPKQLSVSICDHRESEYFLCIKQLKRVLPVNYHLVIVDNTVSSLDEIKSEEFKEFLRKEKVLFLEKNLGEMNKGLGELHMLNYVLESLDLSDYEFITYITARRIFTCPYFFEKTEMLKSDGLLCNPDFLYLDGKFIESHKEGMFNDMIFSLRTELMKGYAKYSMKRLNYLAQIQKGSEQNLYDFITETNINCDWVDWIGLIRNDWESDYKLSETKNFHIN